MSEHFPLHSFYENQSPKGGSPIKAEELRRGDYSIVEDKRIERAAPTKDGLVCVVFERTPEQLRSGEEGTTIFLKPDAKLEVSRSSFHSFTKDTTSGSGTPL